MSRNPKQAMGPYQWIILDLILKKAMKNNKSLWLYYSAKTNSNIDTGYIKRYFSDEDINKIKNLNTEPYIGVPIENIDIEEGKYKFYISPHYVKENLIYNFIKDNEKIITELHNTIVSRKNGDAEFEKRLNRLKKAENENSIELQDWVSGVVKVLNAYIYTDKPLKSTTADKYGESFFNKANLEKFIHKDAIEYIFRETEKQFIDYYSFFDKCYEFYGSYLEFGNQLFSKISTDELIIEEFKRNRLLYGAPGTGKSHKLNKDAKKLCNCNDDNIDEHITRVTFYQEYTYGQFVGAYKPITIYADEFSNTSVFSDIDKVNKINDPLKPYIQYSVELGPFLNLLVKAIKNKDKKYVLIIEEINRGNSSAIFGDIIQLLDRDSSGKSEYSIELSVALMNHIRTKQGIATGNVRIPSNMFIWSTMNSSDENVEPIDAAFKRRWTLEYIGIDENEGGANNLFISFPFLKSNFRFEKESIGEDDRKIRWNTFRKKINQRLISGDTQIEEDKLVGPFFLKEDELNSDDVIKSKLIIYLYKELFKYGNTDKLFNQDYKTISELLKAYKDGKQIFSFTVSDINEMIDETIKLIKKDSKSIISEKVDKTVDVDDGERQVAVTGEEVSKASGDGEE
jgi:hypothetical protein